MFYWDQPFLVGWVDWVFLCSIGEKPFLVSLVDQPFQPASNRVEMVEKLLRDYCSHSDYSQGLPRFNQKRLEKCSTEKGQAYQPKPVAVETVDPNRTRPKNSGSCFGVIMQNVLLMIKQLCVIEFDRI